MTVVLGGPESMLRLQIMYTLKLGGRGGEDRAKVLVTLPGMAA